VVQDSIEPIPRFVLPRELAHAAAGASAWTLFCPEITDMRWQANPSSSSKKKKKIG
jgi:hypothetical protein